MTFEEAKAAYDEAYVQELYASVLVECLKEQLSSLNAAIHDAEVDYKNKKLLTQNKEHTLREAIKHENSLSAM